MNRLSKFTGEARRAVAYAREEARRLRHRLVGTEHLLLGLLKVNDPIIDGLFVSMHTSSARAAQALEFVVGRGNKAILSEPVLSASARTTLLRAEEEAEAAHAELVGIEHLFLGILTEEDGIAVGVLESFGVSPEVAHRKLADLFKKGYDDLQLAIRYQVLYDTTPTLNQVSRDLTIAALMGECDPVIGRDDELERVMQILSRRSKNNPVLIGRAGVGKTAIAEGLAQRIVKKRVPNELQLCRVVTLDIGMLMVGTKFRGDFEERLKQVMQEIVVTPGIITVIDDLHLLVRSGVAEGSLNASNLFKPLLARGEFQCIGATTQEEYHKTIESDPALERRFQPVLVAETNAQETLSILEGVRTNYEDFHSVTISDEALLAAVQLSSRYLPDRYQPDKALDLIDEAAARMRVYSAVAPAQVLVLRDEMMNMQREKDHAIARRNFPLAAHCFRRMRQLMRDLWEAEQAWQAGVHERPILRKPEIAEVVAMWTGIPAMQVAAEESQRLLRLEQDLHRRVIGQDEAVRSVANAIRRSRTNLRDTHRPIGSFVFVGPTGSGKSELARALAELLLGDEHALIAFDMSEFMESHTITRLIGSPPGYVGYDQGGQLTEAVRRRPYSVVLFDEIEKAHPQLFDLLLQILEDGRLTDSHGQSVDFSNTCIILTSNAGTPCCTRGVMTLMPAQSQGQADHAEVYQRLHEHALQELRHLFKPELLNRIDEVVVFHPLQQEHLQAILELMVARVQQSLAKQNLSLHVTDAARLFLVKSGYNPVYGARHLRRVVRRMLEDMLAEAILQGSLTAGSWVTVDYLNGQLSIQAAANTDEMETDNGQEAA
ncbi:ATP-dependent Clp protease ATP-binding subunit ClpC [Reticulibacter mediterranei]|uniref:ATP-dependent Clp protease ATP-binding subunit ClpC n=1 Tax=Reticulibacter mediterranei TaxID=2778369 RepID=A0A8J3N1X3_9CHLR|nr:ATP-dependent Clp protease ATP-binding subunit [Reticulibacter mediterranei]GHO91742.1 ATP-dependent Clp protease ATP-binding subunit ClpC [Reticulibacter mediterranei]